MPFVFTDPWIGTKDSACVNVRLDPSSARRADGPFHRLRHWAGRRRIHPNEPPSVRQILATELKEMMDRRLSFELVDVRTEEERVIAKIEGSRLLNKEGPDYLLSLDRNTTIVFHCHHGLRSQSAAEYVLREEASGTFRVDRLDIEPWNQRFHRSFP